MVPGRLVCSQRQFGMILILLCGRSLDAHQQGATGQVVFNTSTGDRVKAYRIVNTYVNKLFSLSLSPHTFR
jgi:hypothetical protein